MFLSNSTGCGMQDSQVRRRTKAELQRNQGMLFFFLLLLLSDRCCVLLAPLAQVQQQCNSKLCDVYSIQVASFVAGSTDSKITFVLPKVNILFDIADLES